MDSRGLRNTPRQIYNSDETFLPLDATEEKVVTLKNAKNVYSQATGTTKHITMLCAVSAAGFPVPPMIIGFPGPNDAWYGKSDSRRVDTELFLQQMKKIYWCFSLLMATSHI